jgi:hypothetical protein
VAHPSLTARLEHEIAALVAAGCPLSTAARLAGVPPRTARDWLHQGRQPYAPAHWARFAESVEAARLEHARVVAGRLAELRGHHDAP